MTMNRAQRRQAGKPSRIAIAVRHAINPHALQQAINRVAPFTPAELLELQMPVRVAFEALRTGHGSEPDFHTLPADGQGLRDGQLR